MHGNEAQKPVAQRVISFLLAVLTLGFGWMVVLPWVARTATMKRIIDRNHKAGVDPNALFYTDLEDPRRGDR